LASRARAPLATFLVAAGTTASLVLIVVLITGGFVIDAGPLHFSARRPVPPLLVALGAWTAAALTGRQTLATAAASISVFIERHAASLALVVAAGAAGVGVAYGTYSAAGADAAGYVSQAELLSSARLVREEPAARAVDWRDATWVFSPLGYRPGPDAGEIVPTYPPGLPLVMAAARVVVGEIGPFLVVPILGALAVVCTYALGARMQSRAAGLVAAALLATSPIFLFQIVQPMSDVAVTAWWALAMVFALSPIPGSALAAGAVSGMAILTRPNLLLMAIPVGLAGTCMQSARAVAFSAGLVPAIGAVLLLQWRLHGSPLASGYGSFHDPFSFSSILPNARGYGLRLLVGEGPALALALICAGPPLTCSAPACQRGCRRSLAQSCLPPICPTRCLANGRFSVSSCQPFRWHSLSLAHWWSMPPTTCQPRRVAPCSWRRSPRRAP
jgi:hypothetical protein